MKIVQIENNFVHWDATEQIPDLGWAASHYASNILFVEAPDYVFEGWGYDDAKDGDARFIKPIPPEGWIYNEKTGNFYQEGNKPEIPVYKTLIADVVNLI